MPRKIRLTARRRIGVMVALAAAPFLLSHPHAQGIQPEFDVVSIKVDNSGPASGSVAGPTALMNVPISSVLVFALPPSVDIHHVAGMPDWKERYDIVVKAPAGASKEQVRLMWQHLLATRMNFTAHVEEREATTFALVLAQPGRLGPHLTPPTVDDCAAANAIPLPPLAGPADFSQRRAIGGTLTSLTSGRATMERLAVSLSIRAGGPVENRTGLEGNYAFALRFAPESRGGVTPRTLGLPDLFTALQEQLGLRLQAEKRYVPFWVIDHIERPTED